MSVVSFLSTLPARGATVTGTNSGDYVQFLSTLPARGATQTRAHTRQSSKISIHAPREGSDPGAVSSCGVVRHFYPRSPRGERQRFPPQVRPYWDFYPRSPRGERHAVTQESHDGCCISIHAPREGSDWSGRRRSFSRRDFYPRSPRGERRVACGRPCIVRRISIHAPREGSDLALLMVAMALLRFLSTLPARGATSWGFLHLTSTKISIHAPREGSDFGGFTVFPSPTNFYPRSPRGERPHDGVHVAAIVSDFYPRSPRGERPRGAEKQSKACLFLSTLPARGATGRVGAHYRLLWISIHAPREGSDVTSSMLTIFAQLFLSTLPARGATFLFERRREP